MTDESQQHQCATRRCVLLGAGVLGAASVLTACSTAAVPYDANDAGQAPAAAPTIASAAGNDVTGGTAAQPSGSASANGGSGNGSAKSGGQMGTLLGLATDVPVGGGKVFTAAKVVVTQPAAGEYKGFSAVCTHQQCIVDQVADGTIDCPCHGSKFSIKDGSVVAGPAPSPLPSAPVTVSGGQVMLS